MDNLRQLYNREDLISCEVYQINKASKQRLYKIETQRSLEIFIKNITQNKWSLVNEYIQFNYLNRDSIVLPIENKK